MGGSLHGQLSGVPAPVQPSAPPAPGLVPRLRDCVVTLHLLPQGDARDQRAAQGRSGGAAAEAEPSGEDAGKFG